MRKLTRCRVTVLPMYTQCPEDQQVQQRTQQLEVIDQSPVIKIKQKLIGKVFIMVAIITSFDINIWFLVKLCRTFVLIPNTYSEHANRFFYGFFNSP